MSNLCLTFVNSKWYITHEKMKDPLDNEKWWNELCNEFSLGCPDTKDAKYIISLKEMRSKLQQLLFQYIQGVSIDTYLDEINQTLMDYPNTYKLSYKNDAVKIIQDFHLNENDSFIKDILLSLADLLVHIDHHRLKICGNPDCGWIFHDESKNTSRKWCDDKCASLMKVRRYRERIKNQ